MSFPAFPPLHSELLDKVLSFVKEHTDLKHVVHEDGQIHLFQDVDQKKMSFSILQLEEVLNRVDIDGKEFLQVNFVSGLKVLITEKLVGFKPHPILGLDLKKLPKVVTTPDLYSVFEAIQENLNLEQVPEFDVDVLKKVYEAILLGAEKVGFPMPKERHLLSQLTTTHFRATA